MPKRNSVQGLWSDKHRRYSARVMTVLVDICHREICRSSAVTSTNVAAPHAELDIIFLLASAVGHGHVTGSKFAMSLWPSKGCQGPSDS